MKLASRLINARQVNPSYILDEPTTEASYKGHRSLLKVLARFVDDGNTVPVIEHNLDVISGRPYHRFGT